MKHNRRDGKIIKVSKASILTFIKCVIERYSGRESGNVSESDKKNETEIM